MAEVSPDQIHYLSDWIDINQWRKIPGLPAAALTYFYTNNELIKLSKQSKES